MSSRTHRVLAWLLLLTTTACIVSAREVEVVGTRCPGVDNQCSLHGACVLNRQGAHVCNCEWGFTDDDCATRTLIVRRSIARSLLVLTQTT